MYTNLLAKIEAEINQIVNKLGSTHFGNKESGNKEYIALLEKREKLHELAKNYLALEAQFKELAGLNNVY